MQSDSEGDYSMDDDVSGQGTTALGGLQGVSDDMDKSALMSTIDMSVDGVVNDLGNLDSGPLPADLILKVKSSLDFLEQCLVFKDQEFTAFAKKRANELQTVLTRTIVRLEEQEKATEEEGEDAASTVSENEEIIVQEAEVEDEVALDPSAFPYEREEKILTDFSFGRLSKRLSFMRGDHYRAVRGKPVLESGIHVDGIPVFYLLCPEIDTHLRPAFETLILEKRDLLSRRIYIHTHKDDTPEQVRELYEKEYARDIDGIVALAFEDWAGDIAKRGISGLPKEMTVIGRKKEEDGNSIGASLKKVFSFGGASKKEKTRQKAAPVEETTPVRIHKEWQKLEAEGAFYLTQHFSFSLFAYVLRMSEKQFNTEYECICQIVDQQDEPDVGPVVTNLSRLYKFYDNIFFDLVILTLFCRANKFDINMLQAACMSQNFVVDRLPLTMDELRRRPMAHAKHLVAQLEEAVPDPEEVRTALQGYFHVHETIHANKVGKRLQASQNLLTRHADKASGKAKEAFDEVRHLFGEIANLKARQEEDGTFLGEEILTTIDESIERIVMNLK